MSQNFTLLLPNINNAILTKDVGIIPYIMQKYIGYDSKILSLDKEEELTFNIQYLDNLNIIVTKDNNIINSSLQKTDILMLIGFYDLNLQAIQLYKNLNPNGKIYLKLDFSLFWLINSNKSINTEALDLLKKCDLISVESRRLKSLLKMIWNLDVEYIPNGYYDFTHNNVVEYDYKENIILFAGRVGAMVKNNESLMEAFKNIHTLIPNWKLVFAGNIENSFDIYINNYLNDNPALKEQVLFIGHKNKKDLKDLYFKSKIFCLTSLSEACANVIGESIYNGCYLISTDVDGAIDMIDYGKYGCIIPVDDTIYLQNKLLDICLNESLLSDNCYKSQYYARSNLDWIKICKNISLLLS